MPETAETIYQELCRYVTRIGLLSSIEELLGWDERTMMPPAGAEYRAEQVTLLAGMIHRQWTEAKVGRWLDQLEASPLAADAAGDTGATIRRLRRQYRRRTRLPQSLVEELARTAVLGQNAWQEARRQDDFAIFRPWLEKTIALKRRQAEALGYEECAYDALLDEYEPDERTAGVARVLDRLREELVRLIEQIGQSRRRPDPSLLRREYPLRAQEEFGRQAAAGIGFDFARGRLDVTAHPFCSSPGPNDCRITTRYQGRFFSEAFFGILHEAGHGIYEQGMRADQHGLPLGEAVSLGIHESQSRLWENLVGRSRAFWRHFFPQAQRRFPTALGDVKLDEFYFAVNAVQPSLIRVEADEATYNLHVLIRFELEQAMVAGELKASDVPAAWNEKYRRYLGVEPTGDADGVLQDIHWSGGAIGYFPTYTLGNLYAAQFFAAADEQLGGLEEPISRGRFEPLREWLREKIHRHGQRYSAAELVRRVTGSKLSHRPLVDHLRKKLGPLYGIH